MGANSYGALFTKDAVARTVASEVQQDKDILTMAITKANGLTTTGAIVDQDGKVYTCGYNVNGEMGNGTVENLLTPWCISNLKLELDKDIINFKQVEESYQLSNSLKMEFNLLQDSLPINDCTYTS